MRPHAPLDRWLALGAESEHFEQVPLDAEPGVPAEVADELVHRAGREGHRRSAVGTDQVVAVAGGASDVGRVAVGAEDAAEDIDRGEELKRAVHGRPADLGDALAEVRDHLLGGEGATAGEDVGDDGAARGGRAIAVANKELGHVLG